MLSKHMDINCNYKVWFISVLKKILHHTCILLSVDLPKPLAITREQMIVNRCHLVLPIYIIILYYSYKFMRAGYNKQAAEILYIYQTFGPKKEIKCGLRRHIPGMISKQT